MRGLTCGLLSMGKGWIGMLLWPKLGYMTRTPFVVMGGFWGEGGLNGSDSHHNTFRVSGHAHCVGRNGCGPQKIDVFGVAIRNIMILFLLVRFLGPTGRAPRTRLTGEMVARTRFLVNMCLLWFRHGSLQLKMLGLAVQFRGLLVCVSIWCEIC